jgi:hypothetical protein
LDHYFGKYFLGPSCREFTKFCWCEFVDAILSMRFCWCNCDFCWCDFDDGMLLIRFIWKRTNAILLQVNSNECPKILNFHFCNQKFELISFEFSAQQKKWSFTKFMSKLSNDHSHVHALMCNGIYVCLMYKATILQRLFFCFN